MCWQQDHGYYEINPLYGRHPSRDRVFATKAAECIIVRLVGWRIEDERRRLTFLRWCHYAVLAMMAYDTGQGIPIFSTSF